jgi:hypothetical protein
MHTAASRLSVPASRTTPTKPRLPMRIQPEMPAPAPAPTVFTAYRRPTRGPASSMRSTTPRDTSGRDSPMSVVGTIRSRKWNPKAARVLSRCGTAER